MTNCGTKAQGRAKLPLSRGTECEPNKYDAGVAGVELGEEQAKRAPRLSLNWGLAALGTPHCARPQPPHGASKRAALIHPNLRLFHQILFQERLDIKTVAGDSFVGDGH